MTLISLIAIVPERAATVTQRENRLPSCIEKALGIPVQFLTRTQFHCVLHFCHMNTHQNAFFLLKSVPSVLICSGRLGCFRIDRVFSLALLQMYNIPSACTTNVTLARLKEHDVSRWFITNSYDPSPLAIQCLVKLLIPNKKTYCSSEASDCFLITYFF